MLNVLKACVLLASRDEDTTGKELFEIKAGLGVILPARLEEHLIFMHTHPQFIYTPYEEDGGGFVITLNKDRVFNNEQGADQIFCTECGYDQFEVLTVIRREVYIFSSSFVTIQPLSKDHVSTCLCCERKIHVEIHS